MNKLFIISTQKVWQTFCDIEILFVWSKLTVHEAILSLKKSTFRNLLMRNIDKDIIVYSETQMQAFIYLYDTTIFLYD